MYSEEDIASAVNAGILTEDAAEAFRSHVAQLKRTPAVDEEHFRLVTGFNDIFVVIACLLLLTSVSWIGGALAPWFGALASAIAAWVLAEFFIRKRHMALPAIVLLLAFVGNIFYSGLIGLDKSLIAASALAAIAAWLHWLRFKVPITMAAGVAAVIGCVVALLLAAVPEARNLVPLLSLLAGIVVFALAMHWDAADTQRQTRKSDVAFWLHLLAAPLLVHPVFAALNVFGGEIHLLQALAVIVLYIAIALVSLAIDRRALMVSALIYVLYAFSSLLKQYGVISLGFAITALIIGSALLLLSAFWHPCRTFVLGFFPPSVKKRLPPLR
jgi:MFS family permease